MERNKILYAEAVRMSVKVNFLNTKEEIHTYINALYEAMLWGNNVN